MIGTPESELEINPALVYSLLQEQHSDLRHLPIYQIDHGWDNAIFCLGNKLAVRLPRRKAAVKLIENEQTWLPKLAPQLPIAVPLPQRIGYPTNNYPWHWSILPWLDGVTADQEEPAANQAQLWANFLRSRSASLCETATCHCPTECSSKSISWRSSNSAIACHRTKNAKTRTKNQFNHQKAQKYLA